MSLPACIALGRTVKAMRDGVDACATADATSDAQKRRALVSCMLTIDHESVLNWMK